MNVNIEEQEEQQTPGALKTGDRRKSSIEQQDESTSTLPEGNRPNPALKCDSHLNDASNNDQAKIHFYITIQELYNLEG